MVSQTHTTYCRYRLCAAGLVAMIGIALGCQNQLGKTSEASGASKADNGPCYVCHARYETEKLTARHAKAGIGCVRCHGASEAHRADEKAATPPDIMYTPAKVNPSCMTCHPQDQIGRKWVHRPLFKDTTTPKKRCTDCHGKHRLATRTHTWDKEKGKLPAKEG